MKTPIADFVKNYIKCDMTRFHMPGHKGKDFLGFEKYDITEIAGADVLSAADGIISESEELASSLFSTAHTFYSTEGSTTAICAMLALAAKGEKPLILAARNVHKAFIYACALLDLEVSWLESDDFSHIAKCTVSARFVEQKILQSAKKPAAVYLTSPDYLGNIQNIPEISAICKKYGIPLLVDNAHGAYLAFLKNSLHPIHNGADICCDSAHKTLPVLTGGAYLHISKNAPDSFLKNARSKLALFSSTSPSYLILQSLDLCNAYLADGYKKKLCSCIAKTDEIKDFIKSKGFTVLESEPLKIVFDTKACGYSGEELAEILRKSKIEPEFYDKDFLVLMVTAENGKRDRKRLKDVFEKLAVRSEIPKSKAVFLPPVARLSIRNAVLAESETVDIDSSLGRICAAPAVSCPPAVPIAVSGEEITKEIIELFKIYGTEKIEVVKEYASEK